MIWHQSFCPGHFKIQGGRSSNSSQIRKSTLKEAHFHVSFCLEKILDIKFKYNYQYLMIFIRHHDANEVNRKNHSFIYSMLEIRQPPFVQYILDDQTQVDLKPAGQPEHASLNQCQLIAANRPKNWCSGHPQLVVEIRFLSNVIDARTLIGPCSHVTSL